VSERWLNFERLLIAPTLDAVARAHEKNDADESEGPTPVRRRARPELGERVSPATIYWRRRRARLKMLGT
jgi:hypothetical protein